MRYYDDYCLTHEDRGYMRQQYDVRPEQRDNYFVRTYPQVGPRAAPQPTPAAARRAAARACSCQAHRPSGGSGAAAGRPSVAGGGRGAAGAFTPPPPAFAACLPFSQDPEKIEMSFNLSTYQPHLKDANMDVYQTYYLDAQVGARSGRGCRGQWQQDTTAAAATTELGAVRLWGELPSARLTPALPLLLPLALLTQHQALWSDGLVDGSKVLASRWMRQFAHTWSHFATWVPWVGGALPCPRWGLP